MSAPQTDAADRHACWSRIGVWGRERPRCPELERVTHCRNCPVFARAGQQHLARPLPPDYRRQWAKALAAPPAARAASNLSLLILRLGDEWFGLSAGLVREVCEMRPVHALPHRGEMVRGLVSIRGELHVCMSLGRLLQLRKAELPVPRTRGNNAYQRLVLVGAPQGSFVLPTGEVLGTRRYASEALRDPPHTLARATRHYTRGVLRDGERVIAVLDQETLFPALLEHLT